MEHRNDRPGPGPPVPRLSQPARKSTDGARAAITPARLLLPALRADPDGSFHDATPDVERAIEAGAGGFILFGGTADSARALIREIRSAAGYPLLFAADLERGAGQQFAGSLSLPPAAAIASLHDLALTRRAGFVTGREAREIGIDWVFAPVADLDIEPRNPIVGTRAFGGDAQRVADQVAAWVRGCRAAGALACAKHFPGHGRTVEDSHLVQASVGSARTTLTEDLLPFRAAITAGVDSLMTAHVSYPGLDSTGRVATVSSEIIETLLRRELAFDGVVVTDSLVMEGLTAATAESPAVEAMGAGCDILLYPEDAARVARELEDAIDRGELPASRIEAALRRRDALVATVRAMVPSDGGDEDEQDWALEVATRSVMVVRGNAGIPARVRLTVVDDDLGGPHPPPARSALVDTFREHGVQLGAEGRPVVALFADTRGWKGRAGLSAKARTRIGELCEADADLMVVLFGHPRIAEEIPMARHVVCGWGGEPLMQRAAARAMASDRLRSGGIA